MFTCSVLSVEKYADGKQNAAKIFTGAHLSMLSYVTSCKANCSMHRNEDTVPAGTGPLCKLGMMLR